MRPLNENLKEEKKLEFRTCQCKLQSTERARKERGASSCHPDSKGDTINPCIQETVSRLGPVWSASYHDTEYSVLHLDTVGSLKQCLNRNVKKRSAAFVALSMRTPVMKNRPRGVRQPGKRLLFAQLCADIRCSRFLIMAPSLLLLLHCGTNLIECH